MIEKKKTKTISFRADENSIQLLELLKEEMSLAYGVQISNTDVLRKALEALEIDWKWGNDPQNIQDVRWKE